MNIQSLKNVNISRLIYLNLLKTRIDKNNNARIIPYGRVNIETADNALLKINGNFVLNSLKSKASRAEVNIKLYKSARLIVDGAFSMGYGADVQVFDGARLILAGGYSNCNLTIRCHNEITIGKGVAIAHNVMMIDTDAHQISGQRNTNNFIHIGNHVWICNGVKILKGVTISDGAVIAAGTVVTKDVPPCCLVAGVPGKIIRENIEWK